MQVIITFLLFAVASINIAMIHMACKPRSTESSLKNENKVFLPVVHRSVSGIQVGLGLAESKCEDLTMLNGSWYYNWTQNKNRFSQDCTDIAEFVPLNGYFQHTAIWTRNDEGGLEPRIPNRNEWTDAKKLEFINPNYNQLLPAARGAENLPGEVGFSNDEFMREINWFFRTYSWNQNKFFFPRSLFLSADIGISSALAQSSRSLATGYILGDNENDFRTVKLKPRSGVLELENLYRFVAHPSFFYPEEINAFLYAEIQVRALKQQQVSDDQAKSSVIADIDTREDLFSSPDNSSYLHGMIDRIMSDYNSRAVDLPDDQWSPRLYEAVNQISMRFFTKIWMKRVDWLYDNNLQSIKKISDASSHVNVLGNHDFGHGGQRPLLRFYHDFLEELDRIVGDDVAAQEKYYPDGLALHCYDKASLYMDSLVDSNLLSACRAVVESIRQLAIEKSIPEIWITEFALDAQCSQLDFSTTGLGDVSSCGAAIEEGHIQCPYLGECLHDREIVGQVDSCDQANPGSDEICYTFNRLLNEDEPRTPATCNLFDGERAYPLIAARNDALSPPVDYIVYSCAATAAPVKGGSFTCGVNHPIYGPLQGQPDVSIVHKRGVVARIDNANQLGCDFDVAANAMLHFSAFIKDLNQNTDAFGKITRVAHFTSRNKGTSFYWNYLQHGGNNKLVQCSDPEQHDAGFEVLSVECEGEQSFLSRQGNAYRTFNN